MAAEEAGGDAADLLGRLVAHVRERQHAHQVRRLAKRLEQRRVAQPRVDQHDEAAARSMEEVAQRALGVKSLLVAESGRDDDKGAVAWTGGFEIRAKIDANLPR